MPAARRTLRRAVLLAVLLLVAIGGWGLARAEPSPCVLRPDKTANPAQLLLGERTLVTLRATPSCPERVAPLDVVLAIDSSGSMATDGKLERAQQAAQRFLERTDLGITRIGVVSFNSQVQVDTDLTQDRTAVLDAIERLEARGGTDIVGALNQSRGLLERAVQAPFWPPVPEPVQVVVLLSDGRHNAADQDEARRLVTEAADRLTGAGAVLSTVCLGDDCDRFLMSHIASQPGLYFVSPTADELVDIYEQIAGRLRQPTVGRAVVRDVVPDNMRFLPYTAQPVPDEVQGNQVTWELDSVPPDGFEITYWVEPLAVGVWPTNVVASADYWDTFQRPGQAVFPVPEVSVRGAIYLPVSVRDACEPTQQTVDVVLLIDVSSSMDQPARSGDISKREAARRAAQSFVEELRMPRDRVAVVAFDDVAHVLSELSTDPAAVMEALAQLPRGEGTRIDAGLATAHAILDRVGTRPNVTRAMILLTDGQPTRSGETDVRAAAAAARGGGIAIFAIGLGADVRADLLQDVAGGPGQYYAASDAATLDAIYRRLAGLVPCPAVWP